MTDWSEPSGKKASGGRLNPQDAVCPSCGEKGRGQYCSACGERFVASHDLSLRHFLLMTLPHEVFEVDGKFLRTLKTLVFRPGVLASEYIAGRRRVYLDPLRFYVAAFLLHATITAMLADHGPSLLDRIRQNDFWHLLTRLVATRGAIHWNDPALRDSLTERARWCSEIGTMLVFLGLAGVQKVVFLRTHRRYLEHVCLALNVISFYIVLMVVVEVGLGIFARSQFAAYDAQAQQLIALSLLPIYWFLAIRKFYSLNVLPALIGTVLLWCANIVIAFCLNLLVLALLIESA